MSARLTLVHMEMAREGDARTRSHVCNQAVLSRGMIKALTIYFKNKLTIQFEILVNFLAFSCMSLRIY